MSASQQRLRVARGGVLALLAAASTDGAVASAQATRCFELTGELERSWFGRTSWIGDVDGDGFDDFVVGAPNEGYDANGDGALDDSEREYGAAYLYSGRHLGAPLRRWQGDAPRDNFGAELEPLADLDGDGYAEIGIAAPSLGLSGHHAYVRIISGLHLRDASAPPSLGDLVDDGDRDSIPGPDDAQGDFGAAFCAAGDVDHDGVSDLLVAGGGNYRVAILYSGATLAPLHVWDVHLSSPRKGIPSTAVASFGRDLDGDGEIELVIADYSANQGAVREAGAVRVYSGMSDTAQRTWFGAEHHDWFGTAVAIVPDLSGDPAGIPELLIGAPGTYGNDYGSQENGNYVQLRFGESLGAVVTELRGEEIDAQPGSYFGAEFDTGDWISDASDFGQPLHELFVAARHRDQFRGRVGGFVFDPSQRRFHALFTLDGKLPNDKLGRVAATGRITSSADAPDHPDEHTELLVSTGHVDVGDLREAGRVWGITSAAGVLASAVPAGEAWAGDGTDASLLPHLDVVEPPVLGTLAQVQLDCPLDPRTWGLLLIGLGTDPTPGLPHLLVSDYVALPFALGGGVTTIEIAIPNDPAWYATGALYYAQALFALANVKGGIGYSERLDATLGGGAW